MIKKISILSLALSTLTLSQSAFAHGKQPNTKQRVDSQLSAAKSPALSPEEQLKKFKLAEGFKIELVTSEVQGTVKPISLNFDTAGRMWITTANLYPIDTEARRNTKEHVAKAHKTWANPGTDKVLIINKPYEKGPHKPKVFMDGLVIPMSSLPHKNGAYVIQGPKLIFAEDTDKDGKADKDTVLIDGMGVQDSHTMSHNLVHAPGNKIFFSQGSLVRGNINTPDKKDFKFDGGLHVEMDQDGRNLRIKGEGTANAWGWHLDKHGRWYIQGANNFGHAVSPFLEGYRGPWASFRNYHAQPGTNNNLNLRSTGLCGITQSEDAKNGFPEEWQKRKLIADPVLGKITSLDYYRKDDGEYHVAENTPLLTCEDPRFRPVAIQMGPDGALYIVDWYNPVIAHNELDREHKARDKKRGRIWRVSHESQSRKVPNIQRTKTENLLRYIQSPVLWQRRAAWQEISRRNAKKLASPLMKIAASKSKTASVRIHALWALESLGAFNAKLWAQLLKDEDKHVRYQAARSLQNVKAPINAVRALFKLVANDPDHSVRYQILAYFFVTENGENQDYFWLKDNMKTTEHPANLKKDRCWNMSAYPWKGFLHDDMHQNDLLKTALESLESRLDLSDYISNITLADLKKKDQLQLIFTSRSEKKHAKALLGQYLKSSIQLKNLETLKGYTPELSKEYPEQYKKIILSLLKSSNEKAVKEGLRQLALTKLSSCFSYAQKKEKTIKAKFPKLYPYMLRAWVTAGIKSPLYEVLSSSENADLKLIAQTGLLLEGKKSEFDMTSPSVVAELARTKVGQKVLVEQQDKLPESLKEELAFSVKGLKKIEEEVHAKVQEQNAADKKAIAEMIENMKDKTGDKVAGKMLFESLCMTCHSFNNKGKAFGPGLDGISRLAIPSIIQNLMSPQQDIEHDYATTVIQLLDGSSFQGIKIVESDSRLKLAYPGGATQTFNKLDIARRGLIETKTLMPRLTLDPQTTKNLIDYIKSMK